jgi:hypothetical protein
VVCLENPKLTGGSCIEIVEAETTVAKVYEINLTVEPLGVGTKFLVKHFTPVGTTKWSAGFVLFVRLQFFVLIETRHSSDVMSTETWVVTVNAPDTIAIFFKCVRIPFGA